MTTEIARSDCPFAASVIADDVLDRVPGDRDDHEAGERLRDAECLDGRVERVDEPVGHECRADAGDGEQADREPQRQNVVRRLLDCRLAAPVARRYPQSHAA